MNPPTNIYSNGGTVSFLPQLTTDHIEALRDLAVDWALSHGLVIRAVDVTNNSKVPLPLSHSVVHAPLALFPTPFPRHAFNHALSLQPRFNQLVHSVSKNIKFLSDVMESIGDVDPFTSRLYSILRDQIDSGLPHQPITLGIYRSDYLLHQDPTSTSQLSIQQVELNTIASSFGCLSSLTTLLHKYLSEKTDFYNRRDDPSAFDILPDSLPPNPAMGQIAHGIATAHQLYGVPDALVVIIVQPGERNAIDQRWIEYELIEKYDIKLIRRTLAEIHDKSHCSTERNLFVDTLCGPKEVSVVYFRAGYGPEDYPTEKEWVVRARIESSLSVKCPTVAEQLAGAKKVQQVLAQSEQLEKFTTSLDAAALSSCFTGLYALDAGSKNGDMAYNMALEEPHRFVVKPQREGGGNNVYKHDIPKFLRSLPPQERAAYILMELIEPPPMRNVLVRQGSIIYDADVVSELGVYGIWVANGDKVVINKAGGHLLRTKVSSSHEGGVAAGFAVLDSPLLY